MKVKLHAAKFIGEIYLQKLIYKIDIYYLLGGRIRRAT